MAAKSPQRPGREFFTAPAGVNQRRSEALRALFAEGDTLVETAARFGYTRWSMVALVREHRAGRLQLFAPLGKPGPKSDPAHDPARGGVIELRRQGLPVCEISAGLAAEGAPLPLNRTGVGQILTEEGFGRLVHRPGPEPGISPATAGRGTRPPRVKVIDFATRPQHLGTTRAGLLLAVA